MKYTGVKGITYQFKPEPTITSRGLSFFLTDPGTWNEEEFLEIIWRIGGNWIAEVKLRGVYHEFETDRVAHNYDIFIRTGRNLIYGKTPVNEMMCKIEEEIAKNLKIDLRGRDHKAGVKPWIPSSTCRKDGRKNQMRKIPTST